MLSERTRDLRGLALVVLLALLAHANGLEAAFQFDDDHVVVHNEGIRGFGAFRDHLAYLLNRPLLFLSFTANYAVGGLDPFGYHVVNLALHVLNGVLVASLTRAVLVHGCGRPRDATVDAGAWLAAALFVVHPAVTESVTYVSARSTLLVTSLYLASIQLGVASALTAGWRGASARGGSLLCFLAAMATKELALSLPLVLYVVLRIPPWPGRGRVGRREASGVVAPHAVLLIAAIAARFMMGPTRAPYVTWTVGEHLSTQAGSWLTYVRLFVLPTGLNLDHEVPLAGWGASAAGGVASLTLAIWAAVVLVRRLPVVALAIAWFVLTLAPVCLIPLQDHVAERRLYLPMTGAFVAVGPALAWLAVAGPRPALARAAVAAILVLGVVGTHARNRVWSTPQLLWSDAMAKSPGKARPRVRLAAVATEGGDLERARELLDEAARLEPEEPTVFRARAALHLEADRADLAEADLRRLIALAPDDLDARRALVAVLLDLDRPGEALALLRADAFRRPLYRDAFQLEARAHEALGELDRARLALERSTRRWPLDSSGHLALARIYRTLGRSDDAQASAARAVELAPDDTTARALVAEIQATDRIGDDG